MKKYLSNWSFMRVFRLVLGLIIVGTGIYNSEWIIVFLGGYFSLMSILNIGCCAGSSCSTNLKNSTEETEDINYEEVH